MRRLLTTALLLATAMNCGDGPASPPAPVAVTRPLGSWQGRGSQTIGFVSESGRLRVSWEARNERPHGSGAFRLTLHSAVSGRPLQVIADHRGAGSGAADVTEDPRPFNLMVESNNVEWSISVEEIVAGSTR